VETDEGLEELFEEELEVVEEEEQSIQLILILSSFGRFVRGINSVLLTSPLESVAVTTIVLKDSLKNVEGIVADHPSVEFSSIKDHCEPSQVGVCGSRRTSNFTEVIVASPKGIT
jgi:secreted trypsin-like serine protease